jgi:hypothetical protein
MKRKIFFSFLSVAILMAVFVTGALGNTIGNVDGVWEYVEDNSDSSSNAFCVTYGTGNGTNETARSLNNPTVQTGPSTDENQIHYGKGSESSGNCPTSNVSSTWFDQQSGLGFDGNNNVGTVANEQTFLVGRFTHYNRPIYLNNTGTTPAAWSNLSWIDLDLTVSGIKCTGIDGTLVDPVTGSSETFIYRLAFEETPNTCSTTSPCQYTDYGTCPTGGCPDKVSVTSAPPAQSFTCGTNSIPSEQGTYTIVLDGFVRNSTETCPAAPVAAYSTNFITRESTTNHACIYGKVTGFTPTAVTLKDFVAVPDENGVKISWETLSEVNTLGFNVYRSDTQDGEKTLINSELILSNLIPGSMGGALYEIHDDKGFAESYYWLEEIETDGTVNNYGWTLAR